MTTTEHLTRIRVKCVELLEIANGRTQSDWRTDKNGMLVIEVARDVGGYNAAFIASCAGPAEAGWKSTIAAIDGLMLITNDIYGGHLCDNDGRGCGAFEEAERIQTAILAAWPESLL